MTQADIGRIEIAQCSGLLPRYHVLSFRSVAQETAPRPPFCDYNGLGCLPVANGPQAHKVFSRTV
jgi:hypothetical protein